MISAESENQGLVRRSEMAGRAAEFHVAIRPGKRRILPDTSDQGLHEPGETGNAHTRAMSEHPFCMFKQQYRVQ